MTVGIVCGRTCVCVHVCTHICVSVQVLEPDMQRSVSDIDSQECPPHLLRPRVPASLVLGLQAHTIAGFSGDLEAVLLQLW